MKKYLVSIALGIVSVTAFAQSSVNIFAERADLIKRLGISESISLGWYTGAVSSTANDIREINENFLGFSNYLSDKTNRLVIIEAVKSDRTAAEEGLKGNFDIIYTSSLMGAQLVSKGWIPLVERSESIGPVVLALKSNKKINSEKDFANIKILGSKGVSFNFTAYSLSKAKLLDIDTIDKSTNFISKSISQENLVLLLNNQQADAIVVRSVLAEKLMAGNDKYKIIYKSQTSPGNMVVLNPRFDKSQEEAFRYTFLLLNTLSKESVILKGLDGHNPNMEVFKPVSPDNIKLSNDVFVKTKQAPLVNNTR